MNSSPHHLHEPIKEFLLGTTSSPSSAMANTFLQIVPESAHFQVALDILLPTMTDTSCKMESRLQAAFLLWFLYRQHSLDMNPFQVAFREALQAEGGDSAGLLGPSNSPNSLSLALEMLLSGRGYELAPYAPEVLAKRWPFTTENISPRSLSSMHSGSSGVSRISVVAPVLDANDLITGGKAKDSKLKTEKDLLVDATERILSITEQRTLQKAIPSLNFSDPSDLPQVDSLPFPNLALIIQHNPSISYQLISRIIETSSVEGRELCFNTLTVLGPSLTNYDLWIKLLGDHTPISRWSDSSSSSSSADNSMTVSAVLLRYGVFNRFLETCEEAVGIMEREEEAEVNLDLDGRFSNAMSNFCRLLTLILSRDELAGAMNEDERFAVITLARGFGLKYSRFNDGNRLYRFVVGLST